MEADLADESNNATERHRHAIRYNRIV